MAPLPRKRARKASNPCNTCRLRHAKCDTCQPSCVNCSRAGIECNRGYRVRFRHTLNPSIRKEKCRGVARELGFAADQPWPTVLLPLYFVDETQDQDWDCSTFKLAESYPGDELNSTNIIGTGEFESTPAALSSLISMPTPREESQLPMSDGNLHRIDNLQMAFPLVDMTHSRVEPAFPPTLHLSVPRASVLHPVDQANESPGTVLSTCSFQSTSPFWPRQYQHEAYLIRYFVDSIAPMMDLCDNERHFARVVPHIGADCPSLFNTMLCVSAKRLSKTGNYNGPNADQYHQKCLKVLIPALSDPTVALNINLLASIVLLRYVEEVDIPISGKATESHLFGAHAFLAAQSQMSLTGLRRAAFLLAVRQEIYMGFVHSRTVDSSFFVPDLDSLLESADDDCGYANRIIFHCLACLRYCHGQGERSVIEWNKLNDCLDRWWRDKPRCFETLWVKWSDDVFFPEIWYFNDAVITGIQHYHLARILLAAHNPKIPKLGPAQSKSFRALDNDIKKTVRQVCGIAISNPRMAPHFVNASIAITMAGDRFTSRQEQQELHHFLIRTDKELGWPTASAQQRLREAWG